MLNGDCNKFPPRSKLWGNYANKEFVAVVTTIWQDPPEDETISGLMIPSGTGMRIRIP